MSDDDLQRAYQAADAGLDPLMQMTLGQLLRDIPKRLVALLSKILGKEMTLRIAGAWIATDLCRAGLISDYVWLVAILVLIFGKQVLEVIKDVRR